MGGSPIPTSAIPTCTIPTTRPIMHTVVSFEREFLPIRRTPDMRTADGSACGLGLGLGNCRNSACRNSACRNRNLYLLFTPLMLMEDFRTYCIQ